MSKEKERAWARMKQWMKEQGFSSFQEAHRFCQAKRMTVHQQLSYCDATNGRQQYKKELTLWQARMEFFERQIKRERVLLAQETVAKTLAGLQRP
jgi:hypothetical protein